jgi:TRAP-type C4-dicarboxylate transport system substrate-binding protein
MRKLIVALMCALVLASAPAVAQTVLSMATLAPAGSTWMRVFEAANRELRRRSNGQLSLRWYPSGVQGDEAEVVRRIRTGRLDGAAITTIGLGQIHRPILAFQLPGIFAGPQNLIRAREALRPELATAFEREGFVLGAFGGTGSARVFSRRQVRTPTDLRATHPWVWRDDVVLPALFSEAGVQGVPLQVPEVLGAIQTNRVDTVFASPLIAVSLQWASSMQYMSDGANAQGLGAVVFSQRRFAALPADQQQLLRDVMNQFVGLLVRNVARDDEVAATSLQQRGVQLMTFTPAERAQWTALFTRTRHRLVGTVGDAAWISRVEAAGRGG